MNRVGIGARRYWKSQLPTICGPLFPSLRVLEPVNQLCSLYLDTLVGALYLDFLSVYKSPPLLLDGNEPRFEFICAEDNGEWYFILLSSGELSSDFWFCLGQEIALRKERGQDVSGNYSWTG